METNEENDADEIVFINLDGMKVNINKQLPMNLEITNCEECFKDSLLTNLYKTVEFLKTQIEEKDFLIRTLLIKDGEYNYNFMYGDTNSRHISRSMETSLTSTSLETADNLVQAL